MSWKGEFVFKVKAISIVAPSGTRIATGEKTLEVRRWHPMILPSEDLLIVENKNYLLKDGDEEIGNAVALVRVKEVRAFVPQDMAAACASYFEEGWLAWELTDIRPVKNIVSVRAARKIYEVNWLIEK